LPIVLIRPSTAAWSKINTARSFLSAVKYLYCPKCKELRVKAWYARRNRCSRCLGDATAIKIPNSWLTYVTYGLYVIIPALAAINLTEKDRLYIWLAFGGLILMIVVSFADMSRGAAYARTKIKVTDGDLHEFRKRGWR
jgi:hypothetical protein